MMLATYIETLQELRDSLISLQLKIVKTQEDDSLLANKPLDLDYKLLSLKFGKKTGASIWAAKYAGRNDDVVIICPSSIRADLIYPDIPNSKLMIIPQERLNLRLVDYEYLTDKVVILDSYLHVPTFVAKMECKLLIMI